jgi:hypothetical protein
MREDDPAGVLPLLDINRAGGRAELAFVELLDTITTDTPAYRRRYGRDFARAILTRCRDAAAPAKMRNHTPEPRRTTTTPAEFRAGQAGQLNQ